MGPDAEAKAAIAALNGQEHGGRALTVNEAKPREERRGGAVVAVVVVVTAAVVAVAAAAAAVVVARRWPWRWWRWRWKPSLLTRPLKQELIFA